MLLDVLLVQRLQLAEGDSIGVIGRFDGNANVQPLHRIRLIAFFQIAASQEEDVLHPLLRADLLNLKKDCM